MPFRKVSLGRYQGLPMLHGPWPQYDALAEGVHKVHARQGHGFDEETARHSASALVGARLEEAKVLLARQAQTDAFAGVPLPPVAVRLPFPSVWVEFENPIPSRHGDATVDGVLVFGFGESGAAAPLVVLLAFGRGHDEHVVITSVVGYNRDGVTFKGIAEKGLTGPEAGPDAALFRAALSHAYLATARNVRLEHTPGPAALNKKRRRSGKPEIPGYYNVVFLDAPKYAPSATGTGVGPAVRFDVRGHWRMLTKNRDEPEYVWVHPHQRGLKNEVYRPSVWARRDEASPPRENEGGVLQRTSTKNPVWCYALPMRTRALTGGSDPDFLTIDDLRARLNVGRNQVYRMLNDGTLPAEKIGRNWRIPMPAYRRWLDQQGVAVPSRRRKS